MQTRTLGTTGWQISTIGIGTWAVGGWMWGGGQEDADSIAAIHAAVDAGINWIDTAPIYGSGRSESVTGAAVRQLPAGKRPRIFTKFGLGDDSNAPAKSATRAQVLAECEASLKRLGVEKIDLYQLHWPVTQPVEETARACESLLKEGKIAAIGVSNFDVAQLDAWVATGVPLHSLQCPYSILRPAAAKELLPWCARTNVGAIAYSPLLRGMLFGTWTADKKFPADDGRAAHKDYSGPRFQRHLAAIEELKAIGAPLGFNCAQVALGRLLATPGLTGCIVGARDAKQGAALGGFGVVLPADACANVDAVTAKLFADLASL